LYNVNEQCANLHYTKMSTYVINPTEKIVSSSAAAKSAPVSYPRRGDYKRPDLQLHELKRMCCH